VCSSLPFTRCCQVLNPPSFGALSRCGGVCRQLALFHGFGWLLETVEHILVTDGHMDAAAHGEDEAGGQDEDGEAMQADDE